MRDLKAFKSMLTLLSPPMDFGAETQWQGE